MNKCLFALVLCFSFGMAHASTIIEDEPLPFDTRMPPRSVYQTAVDDAPAPAPAAAATRCRTVVKKVRGRKVRQQVCSKVSSSRAVSGKKSVKRKAKAAAVKKSTGSKKRTNRKRS